MTRSERFAYMICFCAAMLFLGLSTSFLAPMITHITGNLGVTLTAFSGLLILKSFAFSIGSFLLGLFEKKISANKLIALGMILLPFVSFIYPQTNAPAAFAAALFIWGIAGALIEGGADIRSGELPEDFAGQLNFMQYAAMSIGAIGGPYLLRTAMKNQINYPRLPFYALLPGSLFAVWIFLLPVVKTEQPKTRKGKQALNRTVLLAAILMFFACGIDSALNSWSPTAVLRSGITDEANAALLPTFFAIGSLLSRLLSAMLIKKLRPGWLFSVSVAIVLAASLGMLLTRNYYGMLWLEFLFGFGNGSIFSSLLLLLRDLGYSDGNSVGFIIGLKNIGDMLISWLTGIVLDQAGATACFVVLSIGAAFSFLLHFPVKKRN